MIRTAGVATLAVLACAVHLAHAQPSPPPPRDTQDIVAHDYRTVLPALSVSFPIEEETGFGPRKSLVIEATGTRGNATQALEPGLPVIFGGKTFVGPQQLRHDFDFGYIEATFRLEDYWRRFPRLAYGVSAGIGFAHINLRTSGPTQVAYESIWGVGWTVGLEGRLGLAGGTGLSTKLVLMQLPRDGLGLTDATRLDIGIEHELGASARLRAGYSWWWLAAGREAADSSVTESQVKVRLGGPMLGLEVLF